MPSKNEIDYYTRQEYINELVDELLTENKGNYSYLVSDAKREVASKLGLSYSHLNRCLKPYKAVEKQVKLVLVPTRQLQLFNH